MSCGQDSSILEEAQALVSIRNDLLCINDSQETMCLILININKILFGPLLIEQQTLWEKIKMYLRISKTVLESNLAKSQAITILQGKYMKCQESSDKGNSVSRVLSLLEDKRDEMLAKLKGWDEAIEIVRKKMLEYMRKRNELNTPVIEGNGGEEVPSDIDEIKKTTEKERKQMVKLWKDRTMIALQQQQGLEDLKAEWDSEKVELDTEMMVCLRGIASLKESP